jgi:hypothetical protein
VLDDMLESEMLSEESGDDVFPLSEASQDVHRAVLALSLLDERGNPDESYSVEWG